MDDSSFGSRDNRGNWRPNGALRVGPLLAWPWNGLRVLRWLPHYLLPWNALFLGLALLIWIWLIPERQVLQTLAPGWIAGVFVRNIMIVGLVFGGLELRLYVRRHQANRFKYNGHFPSDRSSPAFWRGSQTLDNVMRTLLSGLPIWSGYEVLMLWAWANGYGPWTALGANPLWLAVFALILPLLHDLHFFCIHRLIHTPFLYKWVHSVHHNAINPSPWSSLSMHPVEHLLYWSGTLIHLVVPSHPLLVLFHLQLTGTGAVVGHIGFDKIETANGRAIDTHAYAHYLHHKFFDVNYADGTLPLDQWLGTWHDGTAEGDRLLQERRKARRTANAKT